MAPATPRPAASVILLRGGSERLEVLLLERNRAARFMGGAWVFPGGAVDPHEGEGEAAHRRAALREVEEEAGVRLPSADALVLFSRWITPEQSPIRFDTRFYLAALPAGVEAQIDGSECTDLGWFSPQEALDAGQAGAISLVFPTVKHLEQLAGFASADELLAWAPGREIVPFQPKGMP